MSILSPCILPFIPAIAALGVRGKARPLESTLLFFAGFATVFVLLGAGAGLAGEALSASRQWLVLVSGIVLVALGVMAFFEKGFRGPHVKTRPEGRAGVFLFGSAFAVGWAPCIGPILSGILVLAANYSVLYGAALLLVYSLGIGVILFVFALGIAKVPAGIVSRRMPLQLGARRAETSLGAVISGFLLVFLGLVFIFAGGTALFNTFDMFGLKQYFYSLQRQLIGGG